MKKLPVLSAVSFYSRFAAARRVAPAALLGLLLAACSKDDDSPQLSRPTTITFTQAGLYPEGVQYDSRDRRFLVTSLTTGLISAVKDDGTISLAFNAPSLVSSIGLHIDEPRGRVLVAVADPGTNPQRTTPATQNNLARLVIFDRMDLQNPTIVVDLGGLRPSYPNHFANDIAVDAQGNAYVTDSFAPVIYKVDAQTKVATVFLEDPQLAAPAGVFGLNGIVVHPNGYLLVNKSDDGALFKVPLDNPAGFSRVPTTQDLRGADGMLLRTDNTLFMVCNTQAKVYSLSARDNFAEVTSALTFNTPPQFPTTLAHRDGAFYVLYSNLNALFAAPAQNPPVSEYSINDVRFR